MTLVEQFKIRYPEFKEIDDLTIAFFITDAKPEVSRRVWGNLYEKGLLALVAHMLEMSRRRQNGGGGSPNQTVASESAGELSVSYAQPQNIANGDENYHLTSYGQEYLRLKSRVGIGFMWVR